MQGAYGGLICVLVYAGASAVLEDYFLLLDGLPFMLLSNEPLILL